MSMVCQKCRQLSLTQHRSVIRCQKCDNLILLGNSDRALQVQEHGRLCYNNNNNIPSVIAQVGSEESEVYTEQKNIFRKVVGSVIFRKKISRENSLSPSPSTSPSLSFKFTEPPPSGKRALLCGVTYNNEKFRRRGIMHDVNSMRDLLVGKFNFSGDSILILAEEDAYKPPTKRNILEAFKWLMANLKSGDSLVFYFSGHGLRQPDFSDDEMDGLDETICPLDFRYEGMILDDSINDILVRPLIPGVTLHAIIDSSHNGTILGLPWVYKTNKWFDDRPPSRVNKGTSGGRAISFSACKDNQLAADTSAFSAENTMRGAMTYIFIKAIWENPDITYQGLLDYMHKAIEKVNKARCSLLRVIQHKIDQEPVLSSSERFDTSRKFKL